MNGAVKKSSHSLKTGFVLLLALALSVAWDVEADASTNAPARGECNSCHGTGKCASCQGSGQAQCQTCQGKGKERERCTRCGGDGRVSQTRTTRSLGKTRRTTTSTSCSNCSGRGYREKNCNRCGGDAKVDCGKCKGAKTCPECKPKTS